MQSKAATKLFCERLGGRFEVVVYTAVIVPREDLLLHVGADSQRRRAETEISQAED
jgi:hypothetical protein